MDMRVDMSYLPIGHVMWSDRLKLEGRRAAAMALSWLAVGIIESVKKAHYNERYTRPLGELKVCMDACLERAAVGMIFAGVYFCGVIALAVSAENIRRCLGERAPSTQFLHRVVALGAMVSFAAIMGMVWQDSMWQEVELSADDSRRRGDDLFGALSYMAFDLTRAMIMPAAVFASFLLLDAYRPVPKAKEA